MLRIQGPRAEAFVRLLARYSGLMLDLDGDELRVHDPAPARAQDPAPAPNPNGGGRPSQTLADLIRKLAGPGPVVRMDAFRDAPRAGLIDGFFGHDDPNGPGVMPHHRPRSVFVGHLVEIEAHRYEVAVALAGHVLAEYASAAGLDVRTETQFDPHHRVGLVVEGSIIRELTGRGMARQPSEVMIEQPGGGVILRRHYGPGNDYAIHFGPQPQNRVLRVTRN